MKKAMLAFFALITMVTGFSQDDKVINDANAQKRTASGFHAIKAEDGIDIFVTQGSEEALAVSANDIKYRDRIKTEVKNGVLRIYMDEDGFNFNFRNRRLRAYISVKTLDAIEASGGSDVFMKEGVTAANFKLGLSGGGDFHGKITANSLSIDASGGSDVHIEGKVTDLNMEASGGSDFNGYDLVTENAKVDVSGGSDARLTVNKELIANASGGSDIAYKGNGTVRNVSASGGSSVTKRG